MSVIVFLVLVFGASFAEALHQRHQHEKRELLRSIDVMYESFASEYPATFVWRSFAR